MRDSRILFMILSFIFGAATSVTAQKPFGPTENWSNPDNWCRNGHFAQDGPDFKLATLVGAKNEKIHFFNDSGDCPKADEAKCRDKRYVIPGDRVIVSKKYGHWVCAWYQPRKGNETVGWLPAKGLVTTEPEANPVLEKWLGVWKQGDDYLHITKDHQMGFLRVDGKALWRGLGRDNVHIGSIRVSSKPQGNELLLEENEEECRIRIKLVGEFIVAADNRKCGGIT